MAEYRYEAERAAWIKGRRWLDKHAAARRADLLARKARKLERSKAGLDDAAFSETETKTTLQRWTSHEDAKTSAMGLAAWVTVFCVWLPLAFGIAWLVGKVVFRCWDRVAHQRPIRMWVFPVAALAAAAVFVVGRPLSFDLWLIHRLAELIEAFSGGLIAPEVLSRWYAAGWVSWMQINVVLGLLYAGWLSYAWGWAAPAVRRRERQAAQARQDAEGMKKAAEAAEEPEADLEDKSAETKPAKKAKKPKAAKSDPTRIIT